MKNQPPKGVMSRFPSEGSKAAASPISEKSVPSAKSAATGSLKGYPPSEVKPHTGKMA